MKIKTVNLFENYLSIKNGLEKNLQKLFLKQSFILGEEVNNLEKNLTRYLNVKYALGVSSGTDALIVALIVSLFLMIGTNFTTKYIPQQILHATSRVFAFILAALATQFIIDGIKASFNI